MRFDYNPRVLEQLGKELITSDEVAFTELLKNSFDASADTARVHFFDSIAVLDPNALVTEIPDAVLDTVSKFTVDGKIIIVEDNGKGMNLSELETGFFTVGTDLKEKEKEQQAANQNKDKIILGDKGLGRLAAQRLSTTLIVETSGAEDETIHLVVVEWKKFFQNKNEEAPLFEIEKGTRKSYTRLWFLNDVNFTPFIKNKNSNQLTFDFDEQIKADNYDLRDKLYSSISFLYSPFENFQEDFKIEFFINNEKINSEFHNESIKIAQTIHNFNLEIGPNNNLLLSLNLTLQPWYIQLIHFRLIGNRPLYEKYSRKPAYYAELLLKYSSRYSQNLSKVLDLKKYLSEKGFISSKNALLELAPIEGKVFSFYRDIYRYNLIVNAAKELNAIEKKENISPIKQFLDLHNGIKLYRDKYRIANVGDKDSDWLNLQQERTKGQQFFRFELGNVIGYIKINDYYQKHIKETSSRQGLKDSESSQSLLEFLKLVINDEFYALSTSAYYLTRDILYEEKLIPEHNPESLKKRVNESEKLLRETQENLRIFQKSVSLIKENVELNTPEKIKKVQTVINDITEKNKTLSDNLGYSIDTLNTAKEAIILIEEKQKDSYNNYKLMANGLITEVITHELHSILLNSKSSKDHKIYIEAIKNYLIETKQPILYKENLVPLDDRLTFLHQGMSDLDQFYAFLEKTFIKQGTHEDFEKENLASLFEDFNTRFKKRLAESKIEMDFKDIETSDWYVPKGTLTHVFYNLIDNSIHWINERQRRAGYDDLYKTNEKDFIRIQKIGDNSISYSDSGTGVMQQYQHTLFHPFVTGKKEGRGMGLYIVKNLLESFDGKIELMEQENQFGNRYIFIISVQPYDKK